MIPVATKWYEGIDKPAIRPKNPSLLVPKKELDAFLKNPPAQKYKRVGGKFECDAVNMKEKGCTKLDKNIKEPVRKGWVHKENL